eukprot:Awhi_evm2s3650
MPNCQAGYCTARTGKSNPAKCVPRDRKQRRQWLEILKPLTSLKADERNGEDYAERFFSMVYSTAELLPYIY